MKHQPMPFQISNQVYLAKKHSLEVQHPKDFSILFIIPRLRRRKSSVLLLLLLSFLFLCLLIDRCIGDRLLLLLLFFIYIYIYIHIDMQFVVSLSTIASQKWLIFFSFLTHLIFLKWAYFKHTLFHSSFFLCHFIHISFNRSMKQFFEKLLKYVFFLLTRFFIGEYESRGK